VGRAPQAAGPAAGVARGGQARFAGRDHWRKIWSTNLLERVNEEIKRRTRVVGIFPNDGAITRLVGAVLLEQHEHWHLEGRRMVSAESMAAIPDLESLPVLQTVNA
jgi:putative transposase